jgi:hypothetical protein
MLIRDGKRPMDRQVFTDDNAGGEWRYDRAWTDDREE